jgi:hypothetical protein
VRTLKEGTKHTYFVRCVVCARYLGEINLSKYYGLAQKNGGFDAADPGVTIFCPKCGVSS